MAESGSCSDEKIVLLLVIYSKSDQEDIPAHLIAAIAAQYP